MTIRVPVPALRAVRLFRRFALLLLSLLALSILAAPAPAAPRNGGKTVWLQGYVVKSSGSAIQLGGKWHELNRARVVDSRERPMSAHDIKTGAYTYMRVDNGIVTFLRVYQDLGR